MIKELNNENYYNEIANGIVLVDFYAEWCGPCKMVAPVIDELAEEADDYNVFKVNIEEADIIANKSLIKSVPTFIIYENGIEKNRFSGAKPKKYFLDKINELKN